MVCQNICFIEAMYFAAWVALRLILFSEAPCDIRHFLYQSQEQIKRMVCRHVSMPRTINHEKNMHILDSTNTQGLAL